MSHLAESVLPIIRTTRDILLPQFGKIEAVAFKSESGNDAVTELDRHVETHLTTELARVHPDIPFVGEEFGGDRGAKRFWLSDPIDGTGLYIRGLPGCTSMLALIENGTVVFSVIYDFLNDIAYHAERGKGAFANSDRIHVSARPPKQSYLCYETRARTPEDIEKFMALRKSFALMNGMSAGHEHILVATGKVEGRVNFDPFGSDYDFAAGTLLVAEAGGVVANLGARTFDYRNLNYIAANPQLFAALTEGEGALFPIG